MIASRTEGERALVRIHDEYCESEPEAWLPRLKQIVTNTYRRRTAGTVACLAARKRGGRAWSSTQSISKIRFSTGFMLK